MKKIIGFSGSSVGLAILNFISLMVLTRIFLPDDYGTANLIISYSVVASTMLSMSVDQAIMHYFYEYSIKRILRNALLYASVVSLILLIFGYFLTLFSWLSFINVILILGYSAALVMNKIYNTLFRMIQSPKNYFYQSFGVKFLELLFIVLFVYFVNNDYYIIIVGFILSVALVNIIQYRRIKGIIITSEKKYPSVSFKTQLTFSLPLMFSIGITALSQNIDKIILSGFVSPEHLGIYFASFKVIGVITIAYTLISLIWTPVVIKNASESSELEVADFIDGSVKLFQYISVVIFLLFIIFKDLLILIIGEDFTESVLLLNLLIGVPLFLIVSEPYSTFITIARKTGYHLRISVIVLVINIITAIVLSYLFGIAGAASAILLAHIVLYYMRMFGYHLLKDDLKVPLERESINLILIIIMIFSYFTENYLIVLSLLSFILIIMTKKNYRKYKELIRIIIKH